MAAGATDFQVHRSRGHDAQEAMRGEGPDRDRVIISDRFTTYTRSTKRRLFWAHLRRDMQAMIDRASGGESIGRRLVDQSQWAFAWWRQLGDGAITRAALRSNVSGLKGVVEHLLRESAACGCVRRAKVCRKILEAEEHLWSFAEFEGEAPDNNAAERALRQG